MFFQLLVMMLLVYYVTSEGRRSRRGPTKGPGNIYHIIPYYYFVISLIYSMLLQHTATEPAVAEERPGNSQNITQNSKYYTKFNILYKFKTLHKIQNILHHITVSSRFVRAETEP